MDMVDACIDDMGVFQDSNMTHRKNSTIKRDHQDFSIMLHHEQGERGICRVLSNLEVLSVDSILYYFSFS